MLRKLIIINAIGLASVLASSPAKPGIVASDKVIQFTSRMAGDYAQGGLVEKMQRIKESNIQLAKSSSRGVREEVFVSFPVILGSYPNYNDLDTVVSKLQYELFDGPWPTVTMAEHYAEMSYGQFHLSGTVYGWYDLSSSSDFYEGSQSEPYDNGFNGPPGGAGAFLQETLDSSDADIDFSQYDNDGPDGIANSGDDDGYVDAAFFVHSGRGGETGGAYIWSHRWTYSGWWGSPYVTDDMGANGSYIKVNDYIMQPAANADGGLIEIGVFSHEFGHALGLPDLYDTDYSSSGVGDWCLMAGGSWTTPSSPVHMSAWCKEMLGWIVPVVPAENSLGFDFPNVEENSFAVKLWTHGDLAPYVGSYSKGVDVGEEYFLVENRQYIGTEQYIPGDGLLIWHIDNSKWSNDDENHRMVDVIAADNHFFGSNAGDPWPGTSNNFNFDYESLPPALGWDGNNTEVALLNISPSSPNMTADVEVFEVNPHLTITDVIIEDTDGDYIYSPGEYVEAWLALENTGAAANNLTAVLSVSGNQVNISGGEISFDPIGFLESDTSTAPFTFTVNETLSSQAVVFDIMFTSDEITTPQHKEITIMLGQPDVALIDADGSMGGESDYISYYAEALSLAGIKYTVWDIADYGTPDSAWLSDISVLLWYTGNNDTTLDSISIPLITDYLINGGNILMSGQDISSGDSTVKTFMADYLMVDINADDINTTRVYGNLTHEIMSGADRYTIFNTDGAYNQDSPDAFDVLEGGESMFYYPLAGNRSCGASARTDSYSSIVLGFGLEALAPSTGDADTVRSELIVRMLHWLNADIVSVDEDEPLVQPETFRITSAYPNPFNPQITIDYTLSEDANVSIIIYDIQGRAIQTLRQTQQSAGYYSVNWNGMSESNRTVGTGVYFARITAGSQSDVVKMVYLK